MGIRYRIIWSNHNFCGYSNNANARQKAGSSEAVKQTVNSANIDFRKGAHNSGIVELNAPDFTGKPEVKQQRDRVIITLKNYPLPTQAQRSLDVADFSTPVKNITLKRIGNDAQLIIRNNGNLGFQYQSCKWSICFWSNA